jgi:hypothetical protein
MHGTFEPIRETEPTLTYWTLGLIVIVTFAAAEVFLSDHQTLSAMAAAIVD